MGVSNIIGSFLQCFVSCASLSRSLVQENAGGVTQVCFGPTTNHLGRLNDGAS